MHTLYILSGKIENHDEFVSGFSKKCKVVLMVDEIETDLFHIKENIEIDEAVLVYKECSICMAENCGHKYLKCGHAICSECYANIKNNSYSFVSILHVCLKSIF